MIQGLLSHQLSSFSTTVLKMEGSSKQRRAGKRFCGGIDLLTQQQKRWTCVYVFQNNMNHLGLQCKHAYRYIYIYIHKSII